MATGILIVFFGLAIFLRAVSGRLSNALVGSSKAAPASAPSIADKGDAIPHINDLDVFESSLDDELDELFDDDEEEVLV